MTLRDAWEGEAKAYATFARTPGSDVYFWLHNLPCLLELMPPAGRCTLDVGCGEGRLPRVLSDLGHHVVGLDGSMTLAGLAATHEQPTTTLVGDAARLPVATDGVDLVVACMSLMDLDDLRGALREIGRVLTPGGRLVIGVVHPINSSGRFADELSGSPFVLDEEYLASGRRYSDTVTRDEHTVTFHSLHHSMEGYLRAIEDAGLLVEAVREAPASDALIEAMPTAARWRRVPVFLHLRAVRPAV